MKTWKTWKQPITGLSDIITKQNHVLVAGASGSGKSVVLRQCLIACAAKGYSVVICDPKKVDWFVWESTPMCAGYADESPRILTLLENVCRMMDDRYRRMKENRQRTCQDPDLWIVIDEYADLMLSPEHKEIEKCVLRIAQLGRAARFHLLVATQRPTRDVVTGAIKTNISCRIALHVPTSQDSRNIIGRNGAETLPYNGECYFLEDSGNIEHYKVKFVSEQEEDRVIEFLTA